LCLHAVGSRVDTALDLVWLLRGLDADEAAGRKTAPYHQEPFRCQDSPFLETSENSQSPTSEAHLGPRSARPPGRRPSQSQDDWTVVSRRKRPTGANRHGVAVLPSNDSYGTAATDDIDLARDEHLARLKEQCNDLERRLEEAYMLEDKAWEGGSSKNVGRQMARYLNEEVRPLQEKLWDAELVFARACVNATKESTTTGTTIDLHYATSAAQGVILAREFLNDYPASEACPMKIITGRGNHSVGGIAVLGPAVYDALKNDGWNVLKFLGFVRVDGRLND